MKSVPPRTPDSRSEPCAKGICTAQSFKALSSLAHDMVARQYALYNEELLPAFAQQGIRIVSHGERNAVQRRWVKAYFERAVRLLIPVGLDPSHPFPQVANKSLNFIVRLGGRDAFGRENEIAIVKVPRVLPRFIHMPSRGQEDGNKLFLSLSSIIRAHLADLFVGRKVGEFSQFRVTRNSDLEVDEDDVKNLRTALRLGLEQRHYGQAVRLEVSAGCSEYLSSFLLRQFNLPAPSLYRVHGPVNLARLTQLIDRSTTPSCFFRVTKPATQAVGAWPVDF